MTQHICFLPLDGRPVCYDLPRQLMEATGFEVDIPARALLGQLKKQAKLPALKRWLKHHLAEQDAAIIALDTLAYGGLIPSRVGNETQEELDDRMDSFFQMGTSHPLMAFSSILRIPQYNNAEEEPEYWDTYGKQLFEFSVAVHKLKPARSHELAEAKDIPTEVLDDFIWRRQRNYTLNRRFIDELAAGRLDHLVFAQDDTGHYGLNVQEANALRTRLKRKKLAQKSQVLTGSDEIPLCLFARYLASQRAEKPKVYPFYSSETGRSLEARFDGIPIDEVVAQRIALCGAEMVSEPETADLWLLVHTPHQRQGDHCSQEDAQVEAFQIEQILQVLGRAFGHNRPLALADVAYANGSDPQLMVRMVNEFDNLTGLYGYSGWNTPGNTIGSALAMALSRLMAEELDQFNARQFSELLFVRFSDDWLYQADVRQSLRRQLPAAKKLTAKDVQSLNFAMEDGISLLKKRFSMNGAPIRCFFPCQRTFEVGIEIGV